MYKVQVNVKVKQNDDTKIIKFTINQEGDVTLQDIVECAVDQSKENGINLDPPFRVYSETFKQYLSPLSKTLEQTLKNLKEDNFVIHNESQFQMDTPGVSEEIKVQQPQDAFQKALLSQLEEIKIYYRYRGQSKDIIIRSQITLEELRNVLGNKIQCGLIKLFYSNKDLSLLQQNQHIDQIGIKKNSIIEIKDLIDENFGQNMVPQPLIQPVFVTNESGSVPGQQMQYNLKDQKQNDQPLKPKPPGTWRIHVKIIDGLRTSSAYFDQNPNSNLDDLAQALHQYLSLDSKFGQIDLIIGKELYNNQTKRSKTLAQLQILDDSHIEAKIRWIGGQ